MEDFLPNDLSKKFRYLDKPIYIFQEEQINNIINSIKENRPDMLLILGRTGYTRELCYALQNQIPLSKITHFDFRVEPQAHDYYKDYDNILRRIISSYEKYPNYLPVINTHNKEFIQTIYKSKYSYILIRIKEKDNFNELLLSNPILSGTEEMNAIIDMGLDLRP